MRHFSAALVMCLFVSISASQVFSQPLEPADQAMAEKTKDSYAYLSWASVTFDLSAGYRTDKLNWHIAGNLLGTNPNVRSELNWSGLRIYQLKLANRTVIKDRVYMRGHLDYGTVVSGSNQDSDYNGDDRTQEFSRSVNGADGNDVWDGSIGIGPRFSFFESTMVVCPMIGYAVSEQDLNIVDGYQALTAPPLTTPTGPIAGLDSRFQTRWKGPWLGVDLFFRFPAQGLHLARSGSCLPVNTTGWIMMPKPTGICARITPTPSAFPTKLTAAVIWRGQRSCSR